MVPFLMPDHDHPYKEIFGDPDPVADLLRLLFPDEAPLIDFASLDRRNGSYVAEDWRERENDVIWRVRWGGEDLYVYLLLEFQSEPDRDMAVRLLTYIGLLWQDLRRSGAIASDALLPPILPVVLYNGERQWRAPRDLDAARGPVPPILLPYQPQLAFLLLDETRMAIRPDQAERNLAAAVFSLEQTGDPSVHRTIAVRVIAWLRETDRIRLIASFQRWWGRTLSQRHEFPADLNCRPQPLCRGRHARRTHQPVEVRDARRVAS